MGADAGRGRSRRGTWRALGAATSTHGPTVLLPARTSSTPLPRMNSPQAAMSASLMPPDGGSACGLVKAGMWQPCTTWSRLEAGEKLKAAPTEGGAQHLTGVMRRLLLAGRRWVAATLSCMLLSCMALSRL